MRNVYLEGKRIYLRPLDKEQDANLACQWINTEEMRQFIGHGAFPTSLEAEKAWFDEKPEKFPQRVRLAIVLKKNDRLIGSIAISDINWVDRSAGTGTLVGQKQDRGRGYGTEAKELLLRYAFQTLGLNRVESKVLAYNQASLRYAEKCGYRREGILRQAIYKNGQYHDLIIHSVLREEWLARQKKSNKKTKR